MVRRSVPEQSYQYEYDADGNLLRMWLAADMNCDGLVDFGDINAFVDAVVDPVAWYAAYPGCNILNGDLNGDGTTDFGDINDFTALVQTGNSGASRTYAWDAENRLVAIEPTAGTRIPDGAHRVEFKYDYMGRRVQKHVETWVADPGDPDVGEWTDPQTWKYVWSGWRMLLELGAAPTEDNVLSSYTWGLDLAGQAGSGTTLPHGLEGAGTIGGLLAASWPASALPGRAVDLNVAYFYDGNGNVTQVVDWSQDPNDPNAALVARYEYDPFGNVVSYAGQYAETNKFRFSTKTWDDETGLGYWGYRYYNPSLGRWISRDPLLEAAGHNLYAYAANGPTVAFDPLGLMTPAQCTAFWSRFVTSFSGIRTARDRARNLMNRDIAAIKAAWAKYKAGDISLDEYYKQTAPLHKSVQGYQKDSVFAQATLEEMLDVAALAYWAVKIGCDCAGFRHATVAYKNMGILDTLDLLQKFPGGVGPGEIAQWIANNLAGSSSGGGLNGMLKGIGYSALFRAIRNECCPDQALTPSEVSNGLDLYKIPPTVDTLGKGGGSGMLQTGCKN